MEENEMRKAADLAEKYVELEIEANKVIDEEKKIIDDCNELINKCNKILN